MRNEGKAIHSDHPLTKFMEPHFDDVYSLILIKNKRTKNG
jgi:hypothetical protein